MSGVTFNFEGKLVAVTGSTGGIGRSIAESFARAGARVIVNGRSDSTKTVAAEIGEATGAEVIPVVADVGNADGAKTFIDAVDAIGPLEILVNNVGVFAVKDFFSITDDEWQNYFDVNVMSAVRLSRHFLKAMLERGHGRVLMIASEAGMRALPHMIPSVKPQIALNYASHLMQILDFEDYDDRNCTWLGQADSRHQSHRQQRACRANMDAGRREVH